MSWPPAADHGNNRAWVALMLLALMVVPSAVATTVNNTIVYFGEALRIAQGEIPYGAAGLPEGISLVFGAVFAMVGPSIRATYLLVRACYALNVVLAFAIGRSLFGVGVGTVAAILLATSTAIENAARYVNLDPIVSCPVLLCIYLLAQSLKSGRNAWALLAGMCLGATCWLKPEIAFLYAPLPLVTFVTPTVDVESWRLRIATLAWFYGGLSVALLPVAVFVFLTKPTSSAAVPVLSDYLRSRLALASAAIGSRDGWPFVTFYQSYLHASFWFAPLIPIAWVHAAAQAIRGAVSGARLLLLSAGLFTPALVLIGSYGTRLGHSLLFLVLSCIAVAVLVVDATTHGARWLDENTADGRVFDSIPDKLRKFAPAIVLVLAALMVWTERGFREHLGAAKRLITGSEFVVAGRLSGDAFDAGSWLLDRQPPEETVIVDDPVNEVFDLVTSSRLRREGLPAWGATVYLHDGASNRPLGPDDRIVGIWPSLKFRSEFARYRYVDVFLERDLRALRQQLLGKTLFLSKRNNFFGFFLYPGLDPSYSNEAIEIYLGRSRQILPEVVPAVVAGNAFEELLPWLGEEYPEELAALDRFLRRHQLRLDDLKVQSYAAHQRRWLSQNLPGGARVAYSGRLDQLMPKDRDLELRAVDTIQTAPELFGWADYLVVAPAPLSSVARQAMESRRPAVAYRSITYLGPGWQLYDLR